jgi:hypothetical protein
VVGLWGCVCVCGGGGRTVWRCAAAAKHSLMGGNVATQQLFVASTSSDCSF